MVSFIPHIPSCGGCLVISCAYSPLRFLPWSVASLPNPCSFWRQSNSIPSLLHWAVWAHSLEVSELILWRSLSCYKRLCSVEDFLLTRGNFTSLFGPKTEKWLQSMSILNNSAVSPSVMCVNDTLLQRSLWRHPQSMLCALTAQRRRLRSPESFATWFELVLE